MQEESGIQAFGPKLTQQTSFKKKLLRSTVASGLVCSQAVFLAHNTNIFKLALYGDTIN